MIVLTMNLRGVTRLANSTTLCPKISDIPATNTIASASFQAPGRYTAAMKTLGLRLSTALMTSHMADRNPPNVVKSNSYIDHHLHKNLFE